MMTPNTETHHRVLLAQRELEIDQLHSKIRDLERTVVYLSSRLAYMHDLTERDLNVRDLERLPEFFEEESK